MNPFASARVRLDAFPRSFRLALAVVLIVGGLLLAWRSFLARGTICKGTPTAVCIPWEAWYRWPGTALGLFAASGAMALLAHARAEEPKATGRRPRAR